jgi:hypothetical protein
MNYKENYGKSKTRSSQNEKIPFSNLRTSMQSDLDVYKSSLELQNSSNSQVRSLQDKYTKDKHELEEV